MARLPIRIYPDPVLRVHCREVETFDKALARLVADMVETMHAAPGVGLAAPQVGVDKRIAVVDTSVGKKPEELHVLINPRIVASEGLETDFEGCLSIPELSEKVARPTSIRVAARNLQGEPIEVLAADFLARAMCHEIDHLEGILFVDHLRGLRRDRARRFLKKLSRLQLEA